MNKNDYNRQVLIRYLLNYAFDRGYSYRLLKAGPYDPALSFKEENYIAINMNWHNVNELPFIIGHEIGHLELGEQGVMYYTSYAGKNSEEKQADAYSLKLLYEYALACEHHFREPYQFLKVYGIPLRMLSAAKALFKSENNEQFGY